MYLDFNICVNRFTKKNVYKILQSKNSGATAVCALLYDKTLYVAWAGDSQAALIKNGRGINLTIPHKPERPVSYCRLFFAFAFIHPNNLVI